MNPSHPIVEIIALSLGAAWASGINLYAAILVLGILGLTGNIVLPPDLMLLSHPLVMGAAGVMYLVEFFADKVPGIDSAWDGIHTFIRIPAGALLAAGAVGDIHPALTLAAALLGGGFAAASHATKAGSRVLINTSPEPFTNWIASIAEDITVILGLWTALNHPWIFVLLMVIFVLILIWLLPKLWKGMAKIFGALGRLFKSGSGNPPASESRSNAP